MNIYVDSKENINKAKIYAQMTGCILTEGTPDLDAGVPCLWYREDGLALVGDGQYMTGDFTKMIPRLKKNNLLGEMIVKTARIKDNKTPYVLDATAGMGEDSLLLAAAGFKVRLFEYNPVIAALLYDTVERSAEIPELREAVSRMEVINGDSVEYMKELCKANANEPCKTEAPEPCKNEDSEPCKTEAPETCKTKEPELANAPRPDVILLDPMFPERQKSGLVKKKFQLLQKLECPCANEKELLEAAIAVHPHKIVIKRPSKGPYLADIKPSYSIDGKAIRYDCIVIA